jgi:hypothetical protein
MALCISSLLLSRSHSSYSSCSFCRSKSSKNNIHLHDYTFIYLPIHLSVYLSIYLFIYLSIHLYLCICQSFSLLPILSLAFNHTRRELSLSAPFPPPFLLKILVLSPSFSFFLYCVLHEAADGASVAPCALQLYRGAVRAVRIVVKGQLKILQYPV